MNLSSADWYCRCLAYFSCPARILLNTLISLGLISGSIPLSEGEAEVERKLQEWQYIFTAVSPWMATWQTASTG